MKFRLPSLFVFSLALILLAPSPWLVAAASQRSEVMLDGSWVPADPHRIDFNQLPRLKVEHAVVSNVKEKKGVNQHNYLVHHDGRFWAMWSDGPRIEDMAGQVVKYATSRDGLNWSESAMITPYPPNSDPSSPHYNTRNKEGFRYYARGFWARDGELLALVALDDTGSFFGRQLQLQAYKWNRVRSTWEYWGVVQNNAINNFPPQKLPTGEWAMSRRMYDYQKTGVQFLIGGVEDINHWQSVPILSGEGGPLKPEEPIWWTLEDGRLSALFRDNARSGYLYRALSSDNGRTWGLPVKTNFPDAVSKFHGLRLRDGRYVLVSNPHPKRRDPLTLAISDDGLVFTKMFYLVGGRHVDYPHVIEHDGFLYIAHSGAKMSVEVERVSLEELDKLEMLVPAK